MAHLPKLGNQRGRGTSTAYHVNPTADSCLCSLGQVFGRKNKAAGARVDYAVEACAVHALDFLAAQHIFGGPFRNYSAQVQQDGPVGIAGNQIQVMQSRADGEALGREFTHQ